MVLVPAVLIAKGGDIYRDAPAMYILMFGLVAAKVTNRLVVRTSLTNELKINVTHSLLSCEF